MSEQKLGSIGWHDLTVPNADEVRDFYSQVVGWQASPINMGDYDDYVMMTASGDTAGGICYARGSNADQPAQWMIYIIVADLEVAMAKCSELGGSIVVPPRSAGGGKFCVIRDPAGAISGLYQA